MGVDMHFDGPAQTRAELDELTEKYQAALQRVRELSHDLSEARRFAVADEESVERGAFYEKMARYKHRSRVLNRKVASLTEEVASLDKQVGEWSELALAHEREIHALKAELEPLRARAGADAAALLEWQKRANESTAILNAYAGALRDISLRVGVVAVNQPNVEAWGSEVVRAVGEKIAPSDHVDERWRKAVHELQRTIDEKERALKAAEVARNEAVEGEAKARKEQRIAETKVWSLTGQRDEFERIAKRRKRKVKKARQRLARCESDLREAEAQVAGLTAERFDVVDDRRPVIREATDVEDVLARAVKAEAAESRARTEVSRAAARVKSLTEDLHVARIETSRLRGFIGRLRDLSLADLIDEARIPGFDPPDEEEALEEAHTTARERELLATKERLVDQLAKVNDERDDLRDRVEDLEHELGDARELLNAALTPPGQPTVQRIGHPSLEEIREHHGMWNVHVPDEPREERRFLVVKALPEYNPEGLETGRVVLDFGPPLGRRIVDPHHYNATAWTHGTWTRS
jgi:chromosome segregation ATPase